MAGCSRPSKNPGKPVDAHPDKRGENCRKRPKLWRARLQGEITTRRSQRVLRVDQASSWFTPVHHQHSSIPSESRRASHPREIGCHHGQAKRPDAPKLKIGTANARPTSSTADWDVKPGRALNGLGLVEAGIGSIVIATTVKCISDNCQAAIRPRVDRRGSSKCHRVIPRCWVVRKRSLPHIPLSNWRAAGSGAVGVR